MAGEVVHLGIQDAVQTAELLEQLAVSLDRIGSRDADGEDGANLLWAFMVDGDVFRRCSGMRLPLWAAIDEVRGVGTSESLAEAVVTFPEVGGRSSVRSARTGLNRDVDDLPGTFVVEVGVRQAWPFVGFCDNRFARSHEFRLYVDAPWTIGGTHAVDPSETSAWLEASGGLIGLGVDSASVDADGTIQVRFADSSAVSISGDATSDTAGEPWWLSPAAQA